MVEKLKVPRLGQVGIVVRDLEKTRRYYEEVLGIGPWAVFVGEPELCIDRGKEIKFKGKMGLARSGPVEIELIELIDAEGIHADFLEKKGEGIHHLGFFVRDFDERLRAAEEAGVEVLQRGVLKQLGIRIDYAYLDTTGTGGVVIEFIQHSFLGFRFRIPGVVMRTGAWIAGRLNL